MNEKIKQMCRIYGRSSNCDGCPLAKRPQRCNVNFADPLDVLEVEKLVKSWEVPTNGKRFTEIFGEQAFKRLCHESDFATWAREI